MNGDDPIDFLKLFFDDDFIQLIVFNTNLYADQKIATETLRKTVDRKDGDL